MRSMLRHRLWARAAFLFFAGWLSGACSAPPSDEPVGHSSQAIVNGFDSVPSQNFVVLVVHPISGGQYYDCSGTLVAPNLVLTARHCVSETPDEGFTCDSTGAGSSGGDIGPDFDPGTIEIYAGLDRPLTSAPPSAVGVQVFHDTAQNLCNHDLALIGLNQSISSAGTSVAALRLAPAPTIGELITAVGWGVSSASQSPTVRQQRPDVSIIEVGPFMDSTGNDVPPNEFDDGESICEGDSGSPALDSSNAVIGVASRGGNNVRPNPGDLAASCVGGDTLNYYSQVAAFAPIILGAFKTMGATPKLVGGASFGAPCSTSIECLSSVCLGTGTTGYCTEDCSGTTCPAGYSCSSIAGEQLCEQDPASSGGCSIALRSDDDGGSSLGLGLAALGLFARRRRARQGIPPLTMAMASRSKPFVLR
jgi:MYXO-CTERM domain-containing protein